MTEVIKRGRITLLEKLLLDACVIATDSSASMLQDGKDMINEQLEAMGDPEISISVTDLHPSIWKCSQMVTKGQRPQ